MILWRSISVKEMSGSYKEVTYVVKKTLLSRILRERLLTLVMLSNNEIVLLQSRLVYYTNPVLSVNQLFYLVLKPFTIVYKEEINLRKADHIFSLLTFIYLFPLIFNYILLTTSTGFTTGGRKKIKSLKIYWTTLLSKRSIVGIINVFYFLFFLVK